VRNASNTFALEVLMREPLDMMPIREVASWRGYVNIAATSGRSLGGPIGGFLTDTIGWRW
jgi:predicted MFS family arabinose efflux permease